MNKVFTMLLIIIILSGCTATQKYTVLSTKTVDLKLKYYKSSEKKQEQYKGEIIFVIPQKYNEFTSVGEALRKNDAEYITDVSITASMWYIPLIYGEINYTIEGDFWSKINK